MPLIPHGLHQEIDRAGGDALHIGLLDDRGQGLLRRPAGFEEAREVAALAQLRDPQLDRARPGLPAAVAVAVALIEPARATHARSSTGQGLDLHIHKTLRSVADHLAQEVGVGGLLQKFLKAHGRYAHRRVLWFALKFATKPY